MTDPIIIKQETNHHIIKQDEVTSTLITNTGIRMSGSGDPEGVVTAPVGSTWHRTDGGAGTTFYVKESGTGNTGWVAK